MIQTILITDRFEGHALSWLQSQPKIQLRRSRSILPTNEELREASALLIRSGTSVDESLLHAAPLLKVIVTATNGFDHIDLAACQGRQVRVFHCPDGHAHSAAELTWALVLACARKIPTAHQKVLAADWQRDVLVGTELFGKTYGVVGFGRIGRAVGRIAKAFGMKVLAYDPYVEASTVKEWGAESVGYQELLQISDVVSFHVPLTKETFHMLERNALECLTPHTILVNTSRGGVILEQHLVEALQSGIPGAVGLDVFEKEPVEKDWALLKFPNVVLTPHVGANTQEGFANVSQQAAEKVMAFFRGETVEHELPPKDLWYTHPKGFN